MKCFVCTVKKNAQFLLQHSGHDHKKKNKKKKHLGLVTLYKVVFKVLTGGACATREQCREIVISDCSVDRVGMNGLPFYATCKKAAYFIQHNP